MRGAFSFLVLKNGNDAACDVCVDGTERVVKLVAFSRGRVLAFCRELFANVFCGTLRILSN